ncbi:NlpC/P60 family protein [Chromobacterium vaccinii]|uniref:NlpC/P60 family protein n=1 Tax=Chromobacterium vaccinii TaxID=1108595 RepID=UPI001E5D6A9E|nr:NlpC/P60 family protein [Chromobacterium vaccinii]MCD4498551.1 NlpC/P60 family protein [Chromobacterium vaccinii]
MTLKTQKTRNGKANAGFDLIQHALDFQGKRKIVGLTDAETRAYASAVMQKESSGKLNSDNRQGYYGQYQFGAEALVETGLVDRTKYNSAIEAAKKQYGKSWKDYWYAKNTGLHAKFLENASNWKVAGGLENFLGNKALQDEKFLEYTNKQINQGIRLKAIAADAPAERIAAFAGAAHLKGVGGASALFKKNQETRDGNGTSTLEYAQRAKNAINNLAPMVAKTMQGGQAPSQPPAVAQPVEPPRPTPAAPAANARPVQAAPAPHAQTASGKGSGGQSILDQRGRFNGYKYLYGGNGQKDAKGVNRIDCSHLVNQALTGAGYAIPYQTTAGMANSKYYEEVDAKDVKPGDIALWQGNKNHTGIVEAYDAKAGKGSFFGAQSKKGASSAQMGKGAWWGQPQKFLRPKAEYQQSPAAAAAKPVQAKPAESKPAAAKPIAPPSATQHAAQAAPASQSAAANSVQKLLKTEGTTRVYQMADGTVQTRTGGTVAWRNNNPGNLKFGYAGSHDKTDHSKRSKTRALSDAQKRYQGVVDLDQWGNAVFADEASGRTAKAQLLTKQHGDKTIEQMLPKYAVSDYSGKANHAKYAEGIYQLAASRGLDLRGKKIKDLSHPEFEALMDGMKKVEGFKTGKVAVSGTANSEPAAPVAPPAAAAAKLPTPAAAKPLPKPAASANQPKVLPKPAAPPKKPAAASQAPAAAGNAAEAQLSALIAQLSAALAQLTQPLRVVVDVQNGNIVAAVNAANSQQQRRS